MKNISMRLDQNLYFLMKDCYNLYGISITRMKLASGELMASGL